MWYIEPVDALIYISDPDFSIFLQGHINVAHENPNLYMGIPNNHHTYA